MRLNICLLIESLPLKSQPKTSTFYLKCIDTMQRDISIYSIAVSADILLLLDTQREKNTGQVKMIGNYRNENTTTDREFQCV